MNSSSLRRTAAAVATAALIGLAPIAHGDDLTPVFQYQLSLGGGPPVRTFYLAYQPDSWSQAAGFQTDSTPGTLRLPLYSTDSAVPSTFTTFSRTMRAAPNEGTTFGKFLAGSVVIALYIGVPLYALGKSLKEASEPDLSAIEYPDIPPGLLEPASPSPDAHETQ